MTYDTYIELVPIPQQKTAAQAVMRFGFNKTVGIEGFQKLINKWTKALLTLQGSDPTDREYGTLLPNLIGSNVVSRSDIQELVEIAVEKASEDVRRYQARDTPEKATERLKEARVTSFVFDENSSSVDVYVRIQNQAGESLDTPIPVRLS